MTNTNNKIRSIVLAALMVFSVFAGSIAFAGTAAAATSVTATATDVEIGQSSTTQTVEIEATYNGSEEANFTIDVSEMADADVTTTATATMPNGGTVDEVTKSGNTVYVNVTKDAAGEANVTVTLTHNTSDASVTNDVDYAIAEDGGGSDKATFDLVDNDADVDLTTPANNSSVVFQGQTLYADGFTGGETLTIRRVTDSGTQFVRQTTANSVGAVILSTSNLGSGEYLIKSSTTPYGFEIALQDFSVSVDDGEVDNGGSDTTEELTIESNRGGEFNHTISSDDASQDELLQIFGSSAVADGEDDVALVGSDGTTADLNFSELDAGSYSFDVSVQDTTASDSFTVNVTDVGAGSATFANSSVEVSQGDIAEVTIDLSEAATGGTFIIGSDDAGYQANISFTDGNDDGEVTVQFNTYTAGNVSGATVVTAADNDDTVTLDSQTDLANLLDDGEYELAVGTGDNVSVTDSPDDVGTVFLTERSTDSQLIWTAPGAAEGDLDADDDGTVSESEVMAAVDAGLITQDNTITTADLLIHQVNATGLEGVIDANGGLMGAIESGSINVTVEQTNPGRNANPKVLNLSDSDTQNALTVVEAEGGFFIIIDAADADFDRVADDGTITSGNLTAADGDEFNATISVADDKLLGDEDAEQSVSANFEVESPMTELDSDPVNVTASNATISGTTNYAPGTELTVRARSTGDTQPRFFNTKTVTVQPDGTFNASFDFSAQSSGDTFGVTVRFSGESVATADGNIMESTSTPTATATATAEPDGTETATATAAPDTDMATDTATNESDDDTETGTSTDTPGFGVAVALIALLAAALLAGRRE